MRFFERLSCLLSIYSPIHFRNTLRTHTIKIAALSALLTAALAVAVIFFTRPSTTPTPPNHGSGDSGASSSTASTNASASKAKQDLLTLKQGLQEVLASYRQIIVLLADEASLPAKEQEEARRVGQAMFHENQVRKEKLEQQLATLVSSKDS